MDRQTASLQVRDTKEERRPSGRRKPSLTVQELTVLSLLGAIPYAGQVAMAALPNIEPVSTLFLVYTLVLGNKALFPIYIFVLLEGFTYGFGLWWLCYLYIWAILYLIVRLLRKNDSTLFWAVISGAYGLAFGALCAIVYLVTGGPGAALSWWLAGIPYDVIHCAGNFAVTLVLYRPLKTVLTQICRRIF